MSTQLCAEPTIAAVSKGKLESFLERRWVTVAGVALLLMIFAGQLWYSVSQESLSWDEGDHIYAGYMSLKHRDFGLNPEHPPLVKMVAALPLLFMHPQEPQLQNRYFKNEAYLGGADFLFKNDFDRMIFRARMAASIFALLLGLFVFLTAREMFGTVAGFLALTLVVFEPNLLAHGAIVATDIGAACFLLATIYAFYRYVKAPSCRRVILLGIAAGFFCISKHSAVLLAPMLIALAITELLRRRTAESQSRLKQTLRISGAILAAGAISVAMMWTIYGFRYAARPDGRQINPRLEDTLDNLKPAEAKVIKQIAHLHLLPESWVYGLADVRSVANVWPSYMFGKIYAHGVWFYFPVALIIKATLTTLVLMLLTIFAISTGKLRGWREILFLTIPPGIYLYFSITSKLNIGIRHILLVFVFVLLLAAGAARSLMQKNRRWGYVIALLVLFHVVSSLRAFPTSYIAYANELWGGPSSIHKYLTDSTTDWGQQLKGVKRYVDQRGITNCWFAYTVEPAIPFRAYGIPCKPLPTPDLIWFGGKSDTPPVISGTVFMSHLSMTGYEWGSSALNPYREFMKMTPTTVIENGVFVFDGTFEVPHAAAIDHSERAQELMRQNQPEQALAEAQLAVTLAPDAPQALMALGEIQKTQHQNAEARATFEKALAVAKTMEPTAQEVWIPRVQKQLAGL